MSNIESIRKAMPGGSWSSPDGLRKRREWLAAALAALEPYHKLAAEPTAEEEFA